MIRVNKENFEEEVLKYKGKVVVEFWSETCQPCKELLPDVEELSKKYDKDMKFCNTLPLRRAAESLQQGAECVLCVAGLHGEWVRGGDSDHHPKVVAGVRAES